MTSTTMVRVLPALCSIAVLCACADHSPVEPLAASPAAAFSSATAPTLVSCPSSETRSVSRVVGVLGGSLELDGTRVRVPLGAVLLPTRITLTLPASQYMEIDLTANTLEHFEFPLPVHVTIDYSRCPTNSISDAPLSAWYINPLTHLLLEHMGGVDDRANRTVRFSTIHFSGFSIAQ